jgi:hypothetical protein
MVVQACEGLDQIASEHVKGLKVPGHVELAHAPEMILDTTPIPFGSWKREKSRNLQSALAGTPERIN